MERRIMCLLVIVFFVTGTLLFMFSKNPKTVTEPDTVQRLLKQKPASHLIPSDTLIAPTAFASTILKLSPQFIANTGQLDRQIKFYTKAHGKGIYLLSDGKIEYSSYGKDLIRESLVGAEIHEIRGEGRSATKVGYFIGNDSSKWRDNIPTYDSVSLGEVYSGIEMKLRAFGNNVEKLFYIAPNADPKTIVFSLNGVKSLKVNEAGELVSETERGNVAFTKPMAYQEINGKRINVDVAYDVISELPDFRTSALAYSFRVGNYDRTRELIIDPLLASTFLGGAGDDIIYAMSVDKDGFVYVCGTTSSADLQATYGNKHVSAVGDTDGFVAKLSGDLKTLVALAYVGGSSNDVFSAIDIDSGGNVFVAGSSSSTDFPVTSNVFSKTFNGGGSDGVAVKFDGNLTSLLSSTYIGGSGSDVLNSLTIDAAGNMFIGGMTSSADIPMPAGAYNKTFAGLSDKSCGNYCPYDALIVKLNSNLAEMLAATYLGGAELDGINSIKTDSTGSLYVAGVTESKDFPITAGTYDPVFAVTSVGKGFVSKFDSGLTSLLASTYIGGSLIDGVMGLTLDEQGNVVVTGYTLSHDFPTALGAYSRTINFGDIFISKLRSDLSTLMASTFLGGHENSEVGERPYPTLNVDSAGNIYLAGYTSSKDFPTSVNAFDTTCGRDGLCNINKKDASLGSSSDAFISIFNGDLTTLKASTYLGGNGNSIAYALALAPDGNIFVAGSTTSSDFPTTKGAYIGKFKGVSRKVDAFVAKFDPNLSSNNTSYALDVNLSDALGGVVRSSPAGISCGSKCSHSFVFSKQVKLKAAPSVGYGFQGWEGACSGTDSPCSLTIDSDKKVAANFVKYDPEMVVAQTSVDLGVVRHNRTKRTSKPVIVKNTGKGILKITVSVDNPEFITSWSGTKSVMPKKSIALGIKFTPKSIGERNAILTITSDDPNHLSTTVTLKGTGK